VGGGRLSGRIAGDDEQLVGAHFRRGLAEQKRHQPLDVDAGWKAFALAQEHQILEHDIAGRAGRKRAAAEAPE